MGLITIFFSYELSQSTYFFYKNESLMYNKKPTLMGQLHIMNHEYGT